MRNFKYYTDPGHGWVAVKADILESLGLIDQISGFSYVKGFTVYLEEDRDASLFSARYREKNGAYTLEECHSSDRSSVRRYSPYSPALVRDILNKKKNKIVVE
jgi:hypothetical protein